VVDTPWTSCRADQPGWIVVNGFHGILAESDRKFAVLAERYVGPTYGQLTSIMVVTQPASAFPPNPTYGQSVAQGLAALQHEMSANFDSEPVRTGRSASSPSD
jgi:hypothetical protein